MFCFVLTLLTVGFSAAVISSKSESTSGTLSALSLSCVPLLWWKRLMRRSGKAASGCKERTVRIRLTFLTRCLSVKYLPRTHHQPKKPKTPPPKNCIFLHPPPPPPHQSYLDLSNSDVSQCLSRTTESLISFINPPQLS